MVKSVIYTKTQHFRLEESEINMDEEQEQDEDPGDVYAKILFTGYCVKL